MFYAIALQDSPSTIKSASPLIEVHCGMDVGSKMLNIPGVCDPCREPRVALCLLCYATLGQFGHPILPWLLRQCEPNFDLKVQCPAGKKYAPKSCYSSCSRSSRALRSRVPRRLQHAAHRRKPRPKTAMVERMAFQTAGLREAVYRYEVKDWMLIGVFLERLGVLQGCPQ